MGGKRNISSSSPSSCYPFSFIFFFSLLLSTILANVQTTQTEQIKVAIVTIPSTGHQTPLVAVVEELLNRGHRVIYSTLDMGSKIQKNFQTFNNLTNFEFCNLGGTQTLRNKFERSLDTELQGKSPFLMMKEAFITFNLMEYEMLPGLLQRFAQEKPDIVISDFLTFAGFSLADHLQVPVITFQPGTYVGLDTPLSIPPFGANILPNEMSAFTSRLAVIFDKFVMGLIVEYSRYLTNFNRDLFGIIPVKFHPHERIAIVNSFVGFDYSQPLYTGSVHLVGEVRKFDLKPLPSDLSDWLDQSDQPVIYVAMGTVSTQTSETLNSMKIAFQNLPNYRFIWAVREAVQEDNADVFKSIPSNTKLLTWAPQTDLLNHPKIKLFFSHGGYNSLSETMFAGKPVLCLPFLGDQPANCRKARGGGFGETVLVNEISSNSSLISSTLQKLIENENYTLNAQRIQKAMKYAIKNGGSSKAADVVEQVVYFGSDFFLPIDHDFAWYQKQSFDVLLVILIVILIILLVTLSILRFFYRCCFPIRKKDFPNKKQNAKKNN